MLNFRALPTACAAVLLTILMTGRGLDPRGTKTALIGTVQQTDVRRAPLQRHLQRSDGEVAIIDGAGGRCRRRQTRRSRWILWEPVGDHGWTMRAGATAEEKRTVSTLKGDVIP